MPLDISLVGPYTVFRPGSGKNLEFNAAMELNRAIQNISNAVDWSCVYDMEGIVIAQSWFFGSVNNFYKSRCQNVGKKVKFVNVNENIYDMFNTVHGGEPEQFIEIYDSKEELFKGSLERECKNYTPKPQTLPLFLAEGLQVRNDLKILKNLLLQKREVITREKILEIKKNYFHSFYKDERFMYVRLMPFRNFDNVIKERLEGKQYALERVLRKI